MDTAVNKVVAEEAVPIVGIGASAGGLEALRTLFGALPTETKACFVVVQHLDPTHKSMLTELLGRTTELPVLIAKDGAEPTAGTILVIPEDATLTLSGSRFRVERPAPPRAVRTPIDTFFQSLASARGEDAIAIVLSGTGSDGTQGVRLVKETGGFLIAQDPSTAAYDSMPRNAIATGLMDKVLAPAAMPEAVAGYLAQLVDGGPVDRTDASEAREQLARICQQLKLSTGHDFRAYKEPTMRRRVQRRMQVLSIGSLSTYADRLREDQDEANQLFRELLISVTAFFRDPDAFKALESAVDVILKGKKAGEAVRVWVAGCATGEEAFSLAMLLSDKSTGLQSQPRIQIFATDIDENALSVARRAVYPESIAAYVPARYLQRYFRQVGSDYHVVDEIRELCIFSPQSIIKDPPFSRLDLLSCRNVLIYLKPDMHARLLPVFHYALRPDGCLLLGPSESLTGNEALFEAIDPRWRLFRRRSKTVGAKPTFPLIEVEAPNARWPEETGRPSAANQASDFVASAQTVMMAEMMPAFAVVGPNRELVYSGGDIDTYLQVQPGEASLDFFGLVRPDLRMALRSLWHKLTTARETLVRDRVAFRKGQESRLVRLIGRPLNQSDNESVYALIVFHDLGEAQTKLDSEASGQDGHAEVQALEAELRTTKEYLQTTTEELESSNEELQSANEELMSMNEELQSSNEELETSKEELQSINEELETVNAELSSKVEELGRTNADLTNLLASTDIATIFLDNEASVRRFTPVARRIFNLIETDIGRSIDDISARVSDVDMASDVALVLERLCPIEREVTLRDGSGTFMMRLLPYRSAANVIEGAVATFVDVTPMTKAHAATARRAKQLEFVALLGRRSLTGETGDEMVESLPGELARLFGADFAKVLLLSGDRLNLELAAAHGFSTPIGAIVEGGGHSQAGFTIGNENAVVVEDMSAETRFQGPAILTDHHVRSGMSVIIGSPQDPIGVVGVHTREPYRFGKDEVEALQLIVNILAETMRRDAADRQKRMLLDELRHRVKNMLAVVQSVVSLSLRSSGVDRNIIRQVTQRLRALALSHDLNFRRADDNVDLRELVTTQTAPYDPNGERIIVRGNSVANLPPDLLIDASLVLHELVTNAVKHGALSHEGGTVKVGIATHGPLTAQRVEVLWEEHNAMPFKAPNDEGSGSQLLRAVAARREFSIDHGYAESGARCAMTITVGPVA